MRRRSTFIHDSSVDFDPEKIEITSQKLFIPEIKAAREEQLKYSLDELPEELQHVLANSQELHIRWSTEHKHPLPAPYLARIAPGLHVFYTPSTSSNDDLFCPILHKLFSPSLKCLSPNSTFIQSDVLESEFKTTPALQYHSVLPDLDHFVRYLQPTICPHSSCSCIHSTSLLSWADHVDISWSAISSTLTFSAFWSQPPASLVDPASQHKTRNAWSLALDATSDPSQSRVEVGVLSSEPSTDPQDLTLSGFLTVLGTDTKPKATRFSFPSRHHSLSSKSTYHARILEPQGLHPTLLITFPNPSALTSPEITIPFSAQCTPQIHLTLPSHTFIDPYALKPTDPNFVSTYHIAAVHSHTGHLDLEAPDYLPSSPWGSTLLFTPSLPLQTHPTDQPWEVSVPLHLRYLPPSVSHSADIVYLPYPIIYFACPADADAAAKFPINPFDRPHLGYDGLYGPLTTFFHLNPAVPDTTAGSLAENLALPLLVPVLHHTTPPVDAVNELPFPPFIPFISNNPIELLTLLTITTGFIWVLRKLWPGLRAELLRYVPDTVETSEPMHGDWAEPVKGGPRPAPRGSSTGTGDVSVRRRAA